MFGGWGGFVGCWVRRRWWCCRFGGRLRRGGIRIFMWCGFVRVTGRWLMGLGRCWVRRGRGGCWRCRGGVRRRCMRCIRMLFGIGGGCGSICGRIMNGIRVMIVCIRIMVGVAGVIRVRPTAGF